MSRISAPPRRRPSHDHGRRREAIARRILDGVFDGELVPNERLTLDSLARRYGVSMTPIREALVELAGIGIVALEPNRGAVLRPFGRRQLREICHLRRLLESEAARCACGRIAPCDLQELSDELRRLCSGDRGPAWSAATRDLDTRMHELIRAHCGNDRLAEEIQRYRVLYRALRDARHRQRQSQDDYRHMDENAEHLAIAERLLACDSIGAAAAMARHIDAAAHALEQDLFVADKTPRRRNAKSAVNGRARRSE